MPTIPVSVWDQIGVVVVFALLLAGMGWVIVRLYVQSIADINRHYATIIERTNSQWQLYFDARIEASNMLYTRLTDRVEEMARLLAKLAKDFDEHHDLEFAALDRMKDKVNGQKDKTN